MTVLTRDPDPSVVTWMIAVAGDRRPRTGPRRHWWREFVTDTYRCARESWEAQREAVAIGYDTEEAEFAAAHPAPTLGGFMVALASGRLAPEHIQRGAA